MVQSSGGNPVGENTAVRIYEHFSRAYAQAQQARGEKAVRLKAAAPAVLSAKYP